jgi:hypothetical protein
VRCNGTGSSLGIMVVFTRTLGRGRHANASARLGARQLGA